MTPSNWKPLVVEWWISLYRTDGERVTFKFKGTYEAAQNRRNQALANGPYLSAWLTEIR